MGILCIFKPLTIAIAPSLKPRLPGKHCKLGDCADSPRARTPTPFKVRPFDKLRIGFSETFRVAKRLCTGAQYCVFTIKLRKIPPFLGRSPAAMAGCSANAETAGAIAIERKIARLSFTQTTNMVPATRFELVTP